MAYWVMYSGGKRGCVELPFGAVEYDQEKRENVEYRWTEERLEVFFNSVAPKGEDGEKLVAKSWDTLPYPASPRIYTREYVDDSGRLYHCPSFCYRPEECKGKGSCQNSRSCCD